MSQRVDGDTVDPGWDGEPMDNAFVFARHVNGGQLLLHRNKKGLARLRISASTRSGKYHGCKDVSKVDGRAPMSAVARQHVSAAIKADQSSFQP